MQPESKQDRKEHYLQHVAFGEGGDRGVRDDAEEKAAARNLLRGFEIGVEGGSGDRLQIDMHTPAGAEEVDHGQPDGEGKGRHDLEVNQRLDRYPADFLRLAHGSDAMDHGAEDDQPDEHRNQPDEQIAKGAHPFRRLRPDPADQRSHRHAGENLHRHVLVEWPGPARLAGHRGRHRDSSSRFRGSAKL